MALPLWNSAGRSPWRPTLKCYRAKQVRGGQTKGLFGQTEHTSLGLLVQGSLKLRGQDIPGDSVNQAVLWCADRPTAFKHLVLNQCAPLVLPSPPPGPDKHKDTKAQMYAKGETKADFVYTNTLGITCTHAHSVLALLPLSFTQQPPSVDPSSLLWWPLGRGCVFLGGGN